MFIPTVVSPVVGSVLETDETIVEDDKFESGDDDAGKNRTLMFVNRRWRNLCHSVVFQS